MGNSILQDKRWLVVGLGIKTGVSAVKFLVDKGAKVTVTDAKTKPDLANVLDALAGYDFEFISGMGTELVKGQDFILLSPGVPLYLPILKEARSLGIEVIGDIELAFRLLDNKIVAITGTDGKSTTTSMVGSILKTSEKGLIAGNIGIPVLDVVDGLSVDLILALELSSFQLESAYQFNPSVGAILNLAPDHLNRYPGMDEYLNAKMRLFQNFNENNIAVLPLDSADYIKIDSLVPVAAKRVTFALDDINADAFAVNDMITYKGEQVVDFNKMQVEGNHNLKNALAATAICASVNIPLEDIAKGLLAYGGLEHRFEIVGRKGGVTFINDSKATTVSSVAAAIGSAKVGSFILLGGQDKGLDFRPLLAMINEKDLQVYPFGESRAKIMQQLNMDGDGFSTLQVAVDQAYDIALQTNKDMQVILAPGCTSYDEFPNFEKRGDFFRETIREKLGEL